MSKGIYVGVTTAASTTTGSLSTSTLSGAFTVTDGSSYTWASSNDSGGGVKFTPGNIGVNSSTATITLTATKALTNVVITGAYYTESNYDKITLTVAGTTVLSAVSGTSATSQRWSGNLASGKTIVLTYTKDSSSHASSESSTYFTINCDIAVSTPAINNKAKTVQKMFIGVNNIAHKIKKGYVGVNNVAKKFFGDSIISYYGLGDPLSSARYRLGATHNSNYALFAGGHTLPVNSGDGVGTVDSYTSSLTHSTATDLSVARVWLAAAHIGSYALFCGGLDNNSNYSSRIDAYNNSLSRSTRTMSGTSRAGIGGTQMENYALFAGGNYLGGDDSFYDVAQVRAFNSSLTETTVSDLSRARETPAGAQVKGYALFGGGSRTNTVDAYNSSLTKMTSIASLSYSVEYPSGTHINNDYALFGGGDRGSTYYSYVDTYDSSLTLKKLSPNYNQRTEAAATSVSDFAIFAFGHITDSDYYYTKPYRSTCIIDRSLTCTTENITPTPYKYSLAATSIGNYALFGGGTPQEDSTKIIIYESK